MRFSLEQLPPRYREQAEDKVGEQRSGTSGTISLPGRNTQTNSKSNRRIRLIESMRQCRGRARWVIAGSDYPALVIWLPGALLASVNDLLHSLNLSSRIKYRNAAHDAVMRAVIDLPQTPETFQSPFGITVYRFAPAMRQDMDGMNAKYVIDGVVKTGLVPDDDPAHVGEITYKRVSGDWATAMLVHVLRAPSLDTDATLRSAFPELSDVA